MTGIIILNYQTWKLTLSCLHSIDKTKKRTSMRVYLVDNASSVPMPREVCAYLCSHKNTVVFLQMSENRGYAAGNNAGIRRALSDGCDYLLIANNDILFSKNAIDKMIQTLDNDARIGIAGPLVLDRSGKIQVSRCSMKTDILEIFQLFTVAKLFFRNKRRNYYCLDVDPEKPQDVYYVSGCCFAISKECAKDVLPFDEGTVLYGEEWILGLRMEQTRWRTRYCPDSVVMHLHSATAVQMSSFMHQCICTSELYYCSRYLYAKRWQLFFLFHYRRMLYRLRSIYRKDLYKNWNRFEKETKLCYVKCLNEIIKGEKYAGGQRH